LFGEMVARRVKGAKYEYNKVINNKRGHSKGIKYKTLINR
jgi:hypothetical protein